MREASVRPLSNSPVSLSLAFRNNSVQLGPPSPSPHLYLSLVTKLALANLDLPDLLTSGTFCEHMWFFITLGGHGKCADLEGFF